MSSSARAVIGRILLAAAGFTGVGALVAFSPGTATSPAPSDVSPWLARLKAPHRQLFDAPASAGGIPLVHVMNYLDTYNKAFGVVDREVNAVLTFYGSTTFHGLQDDMWAKYRLGEFLGEKDGQGVPYTANPWRANPTIIGMSMPAASIESLQRRGSTFIICNNALSIFSGLVAKARGLDATVVYADMKAHILPNVTLVPAMVIAIEQAQKAGIAYHRQ
jgi:intracellular sulfur oxidation DsrE/DsrF family protein